jgi:membrane-bound metal-dependent hydrolase YbcI (DUF457 family)
MPFTPYHFGPSALIGLPLKRWIDIPVFVLANVMIDFEPLTVMIFHPNYPLHGYFHTFLIGGISGLLWGLAAYPFRPVWRFFMNLFGLSYQPTLSKMMISGMLGIWLHVFIDSLLYQEVKPFFPITGNPFCAIVRESRVFGVCEMSLMAAAVIFCWLAVCSFLKSNAKVNQGDKK